MKKIVILLSLSAFAVHTTAQANETRGRYRNAGMTVVMHSSKTPIPVAVGDNLVDTPSSFICRFAKGCMVIMSSAIKVTNAAGITTCAAVDGTLTGAPECTGQTGTGLNLTRQQVKVAQGRHAISTRVHSDNADGQIDSWEVDYTIYERN